jgi:hypothetical protein
MTEDGMIGRVGRVEAGLATLSSEFAGVKAQLDGQGRDLSQIGGAITAMFAAMSLIGGAIAVPQLARVTTVESVAREHGEVITQLRIESAILKHDAERAGTDRRTSFQTDQQ